MMGWRCVVLLTPCVSAASRPEHCYARRYPDLLRELCHGDPRRCDLAAPRKHYDRSGQREGRRFGCRNVSRPLPYWRLREHCDAARAGRDVLYGLSSRVANLTTPVLAVSRKSGRCFIYSNDLLSAWRWGASGPGQSTLPPLADLFEDLRAYPGTYNRTVAGLVVPLVTAFAGGTTHGFAAFWRLLAAFVENSMNAANATAAVYARSQAGMLDIIQKARDLGLVRRVAFLEPDVVYRFDAVRLFPVAKNTWGDPETARVVSRFVQAHFVSPQTQSTGAVAVLKTAGAADGGAAYAQNRFDGLLAPRDVRRVLNETGARLLAPAALGELGLIDAIAHAATFVASWGSAAHKNFVYVGDACRAIVIYVPRSKRKEYETGFGRRRHGLPTTFRNARFEYRTLYD